MTSPPPTTPWVPIWPLSTPAPPSELVPGGRLGVQAAETTDWNGAQANGWYWGLPTAANSPTANYYMGEVVVHAVGVWITQRVWDFTLAAPSTIYERRCLGGGWGSWVASGGGGPPAGSGELWFGSTAPTGYLLCDGTTVTNGQTVYPSLWAVLDAAWKSGANIVLPDLRGRIPVGKGTNASVDAMGENDGVAVGFRRPQHRHTTHAHAMGYLANASTPGGGGNAGSPGSAGSTDARDGGSGVTTDPLDGPAYLVVNYIIKT